MLFDFALVTQEDNNHITGNLRVFGPLYTRSRMLRVRNLTNSRRLLVFYIIFHSISHTIRFIG